MLHSLFQNAGMIYGYARISTDGQDLSRHLADLKAVGCQRVFSEKINGALSIGRSLKSFWPLSSQATS